MPYITQTERFWLEKGKREESLLGLRTVLEIKFGAEGLQLAEELNLEKDLMRLRRLYTTAVKAETLDQLQRIWKE